MAADLGATTYTAVTWTAGDIITEAKLDYMVANDQAYDSHAAQGILINNAKSHASKNAAGTAMNVAEINASDELLLGDTALALIIQGRFDGWVNPKETWTYASATTVTVSGDLTTKYQIGDRVRLKQGAGYKYYYVTAVSYSAPNTTITLFGGSDYTVANSAITDNYYSKAANPQGFPEWFNFTLSATWTNGPTSTTDVARFKIIGRTLTFIWSRKGTANASNSTGLTVALPVAKAAATEISGAFSGCPVTMYLNTSGSSGGEIFSAGSTYSNQNTIYANWVAAKPTVLGMRAEYEI